MKKIIVLILVVSMALAFCACGKGTAYDGPIKLNGEFTHNDPANLDFDHRYVYHMDGNSEVGKSYKEGWKEYGYNLTFTDVYYVLYADSKDRPLKAYDYYVFSDEQGVNDYLVFCADMAAENVHTQGTAIVYLEEEKADIEGAMEMLIKANALAKGSKTCKKYMKVLATNNGMSEYEG